MELTQTGPVTVGVFDDTCGLESCAPQHAKAKTSILANFASPDMVYERLDDGTMRALGDPSSLQLEEVVGRVREVVDGGWLKTVEVRAGLGDPVPSVDGVTNALRALAGRGEVERDPPMDAASKRGQTLRWRLSAQQK